MDYITEKEIKSLAEESDYGYLGDKRDTSAYIEHLQEVVVRQKTELYRVKELVLSLRDLME